MFKFLNSSTKNHSAKHSSSNAILLIGLGNVGQQYQNNRHNIGFQILDQLVGDSWQNQDKCHAYIQKVSIANYEVIAAKPTTMMNLSGKAVSRLAQFYKIAPENIWVVYDELDLPLGRLKISAGTSNNGHNGVISIQEQLGHNRFLRFRVGVDTREHREIPGREYVLQDFATQDQELLRQSQAQVVEAIKTAISHSPKTAMQQYNKASV